jgi:hypothetical protein
METDASKASESWAAAAISLGKDLVSFLRDGALFLPAVLLVVAPVRFNSMLAKAGFVEGTLGGFKWQSVVQSSRALEDTRTTISDLQGKNEELAKVLEEISSKINDPALAKRIAKFEADNRTLKDTTRQTQSTVSQAIESNAPLAEKALAVVPRTKSDYSVGLQTLGFTDSERTAINEKLRSDGYSLDPLTASYTERPSWFADRSTVFYYSSSSFPAAQELARFFQSLTGQEFKVKQGAGLGVDPSRRDVTLFVHYVKS